MDTKDSTQGCAKIFENHTCVLDIKCIEPYWTQSTCTIVSKGPKILEKQGFFAMRRLALSILYFLPIY